MGKEEINFAKLPMEEAIAAIKELIGLDQEEAENIQTTEGILRELILGGRKDITDICKKLLKTGVFEKVMPIFILAGYMGNTGARYSRNLPGQCEELKEKYRELKIYRVILENTQ